MDVGSFDLVAENIVKCPVTGLPITTRPEWTDVPIVKGYKADFHLIGKNVYHIAPKGIAGKMGSLRLLEIGDRILEEMGLAGKPYVTLRDYRRLSGVTRQSRIQVTEYLRRVSEEGMMAGFFAYNVPWLVKLSYNVGISLNKEMPLPVETFGRYPEAIRKALDVLDQKSFEKAQRGIEDFLNKDWSYEGSEFSTDFGVMSENILCTKSHGRVEAEHIEKVVGKQLQALKESGLSNLPGYYRISEWSSIERASWKARRLYIDQLKKLDEVVPCYLAVMVGTRPIVATLANSTSPFLPFRITFVPTMEKALEAIRRHRAQRLGISDPIESKRRSRFGRKDMKRFNADLLQRLGGLTWQKRPLDSVEVDEDHPFKEVIDCISVIKEDIDGILTEKEDLAKQSAHSVKLASIGELSAGVAHEINNPLTVLRGSVELLKDELQDESVSKETLLEYLDELEGSIERIVTVVKSLRTFSRMEPDLSEKCSLATGVRNAIGLVGRLLESQGISIREDLDSSVEVLGGIGQVDQIAVNLLTNARDAILQTHRDGGEVFVEVKKEFNRAVLKVSDNGSGMSQEEIDRVFDTFYTTKPAGKGTGLGLSIVSSMVTGMKGNIEVESTPGKGTAFRVVFPLHEN